MSSPITSPRTPTSPTSAPQAPAAPAATSPIKLFSDFALIEPIQRAIKERGYTEPTPIQRDAIPVILEGRDVLGCAQTGTGKTAAFALPILNDLMTYRPRGQKNGHRVPVRVLILTPTRELASQIADSFSVYGKHLPIRHTVVFGGVGQMPQVRDLRRGVEVLVATPGRLNDLIEQGHAKLNDIEVFVLDEADRMLDMGFLPQVRRILTVLPKDRQTLFFSATMPREIGQLAGEILENPVQVSVAPAATTAERVEQSVFFVHKDQKRALLEHVLTDKGITRALVFTRTKHGADRVARHLEGVRVRSAAIHGNKSQGAREKALDEFKRGQVRVLVATDIAARGIDVKDVSHVINFDLPNEPESYVHRIGRTARAGREGIALSFCDREERSFLRDIERTIRMRLEINAAHPYHEEAPPPREATGFQGGRGHPGGRGQQGGRGRGAGGGFGGGGRGRGAGSGGFGGGGGGGGRNSGPRPGQGRPQGFVPRPPQATSRPRPIAGA